MASNRLAVNNLIVRYNYIFFACIGGSFYVFSVLTVFSLGVFLSHQVIDCECVCVGSGAQMETCFTTESQRSTALNMNLSLSISLSVLKEVLKCCQIEL